MLSAFPFTAGLQVPTGLETVLASMPIDFSDLESKEIQDRNVRSAAETEPGFHAFPPIFVYLVGLVLKALV